MLFICIYNADLTMLKQPPPNSLVLWSMSLGYWYNIAHTCNATNEQIKEATKYKFIY